MRAKLLLLLGLLAAAGVWRAVAYDANNDGMSDVFADHYGLSQDSAEEDEDGDGFTNLEESLWGTDPTDPTANFTGLQRHSENIYLFFWDSLAGKRYGVQFSDDLVDWSPLGNLNWGNGNQITFGTQVIGPKGFWRLKYEGEQDTDSDGLSLMEENLLGTDDTKADTDGDYILDVNEYLAGTQPAVADDPPAVQFDPAPGDYTAAQSVQLENLALPDYIYYTTDGSEPTLFSSKYDGTAIGTGEDALLEIRAKIILPDGSESVESSGTYRVGVYADAPQTVYYGWVTASGGLGYAYDSDDLAQFAYGNIYAPNEYLTMGSGWIVDGVFETEKDATSQPVYYGMTLSPTNGTTQPIEGYSTDATGFYDARPTANFFNYRPVGDGWIERFDDFSPDIEGSASQTVYYTSLIFSSGTASYPRHIYNTHPHDQWGNQTYAQTIAKGWVLSVDEMSPDTSIPSSMVRYGTVGSDPSVSPAKRIATNHADEIGNTHFVPYNSIRLGYGWAKGDGGMIPDKSLPPQTLYYGEKSYTNNEIERIYTPYETDIIPSSSPLYPYRRLIEVGPSYSLDGDSYELAWASMPQDVFKGTENIYPASMAHETDFLSYDTSKLQSTPVPVQVGNGWIENNTFIEYLGTGDLAEDIDDDGLTLQQEMNAGTNPNYFDTDGDLIPDGFEAASDHLDPLVPDPLRGEDFDGDGLDTYEELINGSNPDEYDTDEDGVNDGEEVEYGTDPYDDTSKPFDPYDFVGPAINDPDCEPIGDLGVFFSGSASTGYSVVGTVGDPSFSESERWRLLFGRDSGNRKAESQEFGVVDDFELNLHGGLVFEITLEHVATNLGDEPDYDYEATLTDIEGFLLSDPDSLLGTGNDVDIATVEGYKAYLAPIKSVSFSESFSGGDAVGPRYRKVALNGRPLSDEKPEQESETEQHPEETYIDAFDLSLHHDTSYIYTPLASSDLVLQATASARETSWSDRRGLKPHESLTMPFGAAWSSNLCAYVESVETLGDVQTDPISINVVDESGRSQRFATNNLITFSPWPSSRVDKKTWLNTLDGLDTDADGIVDRLVYSKKYGTTLTYDLCDAWFMYSTDRVEGSNEVKRHRYFRLTQVEDRYGNVMTYDYDNYDETGEFVSENKISLIPAVIQSSQYPGQFISIQRSADCRRVERITDSRANAIDFTYDEVQVFGSPVKQLTSVDYPDGTTKHYTYETALDTQVDADSGDVTNHFHCNIKKITDKNGASHTFHYAFDHSKSYYISGDGRVEFAVNINYLPEAVEDHLNQQLTALNEQVPPGTAEYKQMYGLPRRVEQVDLPAGVVDGEFVESIGSADFAKTPGTQTTYGPSFSAASGTTVTDALGNVTAYTFGGPNGEDISGEVVDVDDTSDSLSTEWMIYYTQMEVHHGALEGQPGHLGKETFNFDLASGLSLSSMTDFSGNTTTWLFEDNITDGRKLPQLDNAAAFMSKWADPTQKTDALGRVETYQYGNHRIMTQVDDVHGTVTATQVDAKGRRSSKTVTDASGTKLLEEDYTYADQDADPTNDAFPGFMVEKRVVAYQNLSGETWEQDLVTQYVPDNRGRLWKEIVDPVEDGEPVESSGLALTTEYAYDFNNNRTSVTDPRGNETLYTYDELNRLVQVTYPVAGTDYDDATGLPVEAAATTRKLYDPRGNLAVEVDENGHHSLHFYDALSRRIKTVRDMDGLGLPTLPLLTEPQIVELDEDTHITAADIVTASSYNAVNSLDTKTDPRGTVTKHFYDALQRIAHSYTHFEPGDANADGTENGTAVADSSEKTHTEFLYETAQNTGASGFGTEGFKPTQIIRHDAVRGAEGASGLWTLNSHFTYDADYRETQSRIEYTPGNFKQTDTAYGVITSGKEALISTVTDARSKVTRTSRDGLGRTTFTEDAYGTADQISTSTAYTSTGLAWKSTDPNGNETQTEYDLAGRPVKTWQPDPATGLVHATNSPVTETIYDAASNTIATINPLGNRWDYTFDARNRKVKEEAPAVVDAETAGAPTVRPTTETFFDGVGNVVAQEDARGAVTETDFDRANRPTSTTTPAVPVFGVTGDVQLTATTEYDKNSNVIKATDFEGNATVNFYDALNRLVATATNAVTGQPSEIEGSPATDDIVVSNTHDDAGNLVQVTDGEGAVTGFRYDGLARRTKTIWDEGADLERVKTMTHDALVLTQRTDEKGQVTQYLYDDLHRLEDVIYVGRTVDNRHYTYDDNSNILTVTHPNEANTLRDTASTWDALNRLTGETSADVTHSYTLDKAGNRLGATYGQTSLQIVSTYDPLNRLATLTEGSRVTTYAYNLNGSIVEKVLPNDVTVECTFDLLGRKKSSSNTAGGAAQPFAQYLYQHDKQGNLVEIVEAYPNGNLTARTVTNTYDEVYRLDAETIAVSGGSTTVTDYNYDDAHNRSQKSVTVDAGTPVTTSYTYGDGTTASTANSNQLVSFTEGSNTVLFIYDANGNRATRTESSQTDTYSYDYENRLLDLDYQTGSADTGLYEYGYDYRTRRTIRDESAITGRSKDLIVFSGGTSAQEHETSIWTTPEVEYIRGSGYGGGIGSILYSLRSGTPSINHYNSRGDVVAKTDASGTLDWEAQYEFDGTRTAELGTNLDRQRTNTMEEDPHGLVLNNLRYRDLETGTFITRDPAGFIDSENVYIYVTHNGWTYFDPLGLEKDWIAKTAEVMSYAQENNLVAVGLSKNKTFQREVESGNTILSAVEGAGQGFQGVVDSAGATSAFVSHDVEGEITAWGAYGPGMGASMRRDGDGDVAVGFLFGEGIGGGVDVDFSSQRDISEDNFEFTQTLSIQGGVGPLSGEFVPTKARGSADGKFEYSYGANLNVSTPGTASYSAGLGADVVIDSSGDVRVEKSRKQSISFGGGARAFVKLESNFKLKDDEDRKSEE